jgi:hypothetical protein
VEEFSLDWADSPLTKQSIIAFFILSGQVITEGESVKIFQAVVIRLDISFKLIIL